MSALKKAGEALVRLIYPRRAWCVGCGSQSGMDQDWLCPACRERLAKNWVGAQPPLPGSGLSGAAFAFLYAGPAGSVVRRLKYQGITRLADMMAGAMLDAFRALGPTGADCVVFVPMHSRRQRRRGFNHAELLAERVARGLDLECLDALVRTRDTRQQAKLSDEQRLKNMDGAVALKGDVRGRRVLLVDDVRTTGATARACARVLLEGGASSVYLLCYAVADRTN